MDALFMPLPIQEEMDALAKAIIAQIHTDTLTGLQDKVAFYRILEEQTAHAIRDNFDLVLALVEVDEMKLLNMKYGYENADMVLTNLAAILTRRCSERTEDGWFSKAFRRSGDEFLVLTRVERNASIEHFFETILSGVRSTQVAIGEHTTKFTVSVGYACFKQDESDEEFVARVEKAVRLAKKRGRNRIVPYDAEAVVYVETADYRKDCPACGSFFTVSIPLTSLQPSKLQCPGCGASVAILSRD